MHLQDGCVGIAESFLSADFGPLERRRIKEAVRERPPECAGKSSFLSSNRDKTKVSEQRRSGDKGNFQSKVLESRVWACSQGSLKCSRYSDAVSFASLQNYRDMPGSPRNIVNTSSKRLEYLWRTVMLAFGTD